MAVRVFTPSQTRTVVARSNQGRHDREPPCRPAWQPLSPIRAATSPSNKCCFPHTTPYCISILIFVLDFAIMDIPMKHELEASLAKEAQLISSGRLKEDNPLDLSDNFRLFCEACRRGDLKVCQEMISGGVNVNARDRFDYTPLILVSLPRSCINWRGSGLPPARCSWRPSDQCVTRPAFADTTKLFDYC
jgi:hypothetical protein